MVWGHSGGWMPGEGGAAGGLSGSPDSAPSPIKGGRSGLGVTPQLSLPLRFLFRPAFASASASPADACPPPTQGNKEGTGNALDSSQSEPARYAVLIAKSLASSRPASSGLPPSFCGPSPATRRKESAKGRSGRKSQD